MKQPFEYKGYLGSAEVDLDDNLLVGRLLFIKDVVSYVADSPRALEAAFREAVDDYLATCAQLGDQPDAPCKGTFNVRVGPDRHKEAVLAALKRGISLNDLVSQAIDAFVHDRPTDQVTNHFTVNVHGSIKNPRVATSGQSSSWVGSATTAAATDFALH